MEIYITPNFVLGYYIYKGNVLVSFCRPVYVRGEATSLHLNKFDFKFKKKECNVLGIFGFTLNQYVGQIS